VTKLYAVNETNCPVRVTVTAVEGQPDTRLIILTSEPIEPEQKVLWAATIQKNIHRKVLLPGDYKRLHFQIDNRIGAYLKEGHDREKNRFIVIAEFTC
jgi:hypothetical protein